MVERVPSNGSCRRCQRALGLASVKRDGAWYCCVDSAEGRDCLAGDHQPRVPADRLTPVPRRFYGARRPKELKSSA